MKYVPEHCKWLSETEIGSTMQVETKYEKGDGNKMHLFAQVYMIIWQRSRTKMNKALSVLVLFLFVFMYLKMSMATLACTQKLGRNAQKQKEITKTGCIN